jgi:hypothetical protein
MMAMLITPTASRDFTILISTILSSMMPGIMIHTIILRAGRLVLAGDGVTRITDMAGDTLIMVMDILTMVGDIRVITHLITAGDIILQFMLIPTIINTDKGVQPELT